MHLAYQPSVNTPYIIHIYITGLPGDFREIDFNKHFRISLSPSHPNLPDTIIRFQSNQASWICMCMFAADHTKGNPIDRRLKSPAHASCVLLTASDGCAQISTISAACIMSSRHSASSESLRNRWVPWHTFQQDLHHILLSIMTSYCTIFGKSCHVVGGIWLICEEKY